MKKQLLANVAQDLYEKLPAIKHVLMRPDNHSESGLSTTHIGILFMLKSHGRMAMKDITARIFLSKAYVTALVDRLIEEGLVEREYSKEDRRVIYIQITDKGRTYLDHFRSHLLKGLESRLSILSEQDLAELPQALATLERILTKIK